MWLIALTKHGSLFNHFSMGKYTTDSKHVQKLSTELNTLVPLSPTLCLSIWSKQLATEVLNEVQNKYSRSHK